MAVDDSYTKLLLHCDGADASTTFTDEAGNTIAAVGNAQIDTAQSKFGGASLLLDGSGDYLSVPDSNDWRLDDGSNSNKWTVDFWVRFNGDPGTASMGFLSQYVDAWHRWGIFLSSGNTLRFLIYDGDGYIFIVDNTWNPAGNVWYHVAVVKNGTSGYMMFVDGTQIGSTQTMTHVMQNLASSLMIGRNQTASTTYQDFNGWMDELRISKGIARWTSNFTPPASAYTPPSTFVPKTIWFMG